MNIGDNPIFDMGRYVYIQVTRNDVDSSPFKGTVSVISSNLPPKEGQP